MATRRGDQAGKADIEGTFISLSDADLLRLKRFAQLRSRLVPWMDWEDLLQEAVARALDGRRKWPRTVDFIAFMRQTIRSIASEHLRREQRKPVHIEFTDERISDGQHGASAQPERAAIAADLLDQIQAMFRDDPEALAILTGLATDESPAEIQERAGMSAIQYASAQKRIRRGLARTFTAGDTR